MLVPAASIFWMLISDGSLEGVSGNEGSEPQHMALVLLMALNYVIFGVTTKPHKGQGDGLRELISHCQPLWLNSENN